MSDPEDVDRARRRGAGGVRRRRHARRQRGHRLARALDRRHRPGRGRAGDDHAHASARTGSSSGCCPACARARAADVIAISSSELNAMQANGAPYNMAKAALEALALTLAHEEMANGMRVNIVAPGLVVTDMGAKLVKAKLGLDDMSELDATQPLGRLVRPEDVARGRALPVPRAAMVTGQRIVVDGGVDASPTGMIDDAFAPLARAALGLGRGLRLTIRPELDQHRRAAARAGRLRARRLRDDLGAVGRARRGRDVRDDQRRDQLHRLRRGRRGRVPARGSSAGRAARPRPRARSATDGRLLATALGSFVIRPARTAPSPPA